MEVTYPSIRPHNPNKLRAAPAGITVYGLERVLPRIVVGVGSRRAKEDWPGCRIELMREGMEGRRLDVARKQEIKYIHT